MIFSITSKKSSFVFSVQFQSVPWRPIKFKSAFVKVLVWGWKNTNRLYELMMTDAHMRRRKLQFIPSVMRLARAEKKTWTKWPHWFIRNSWYVFTTYKTQQNHMHILWNTLHILWDTLVMLYNVSGVACMLYVFIINFTSVPEQTNVHLLSIIDLWINFNK